MNNWILSDSVAGIISLNQHIGAFFDTHRIGQWQTKQRGYLYLDRRYPFTVSVLIKYRCIQDRREHPSRLIQCHPLTSGKKTKNLSKSSTQSESAQRPNVCQAVPPPNNLSKPNFSVVISKSSLRMSSTCKHEAGICEWVPKWRLMKRIPF